MSTMIATAATVEMMDELSAYALHLAELDREIKALEAQRERVKARVMPMIEELSEATGAPIELPGVATFTVASEATVTSYNAAAIDALIAAHVGSRSAVVRGLLAGLAAARKTTSRRRHLQVRIAR